MMKAAALMTRQGLCLSSLCATDYTNIKPRIHEKYIADSKREYSTKESENS
jgi:hypothetical protein